MFSGDKVQDQDSLYEKIFTDIIGTYDVFLSAPAKNQ